MKEQQRSPRRYRRSGIPYFPTFADEIPRRGGAHQRDENVTVRCESCKTEKRVAVASFERTGIPGECCGEVMEMASS